MVFRERKYINKHKPNENQYHRQKQVNPVRDKYHHQIIGKDSYVTIDFECRKLLSFPTQLTGLHQFPVSNKG